MESIVLKPWGSFQVIEEGEKYTLKRLLVKKEGRLSYQSHNHRSEHWVVVKGKAEVTLNNQITILNENENIYIPMKAKHSLANNEEEDLLVIEVWYGDILDENDIIRYNDIYSRD